MFMRYTGGGVGHANQDSRWKMRDDGDCLDEEMDIDSDNETGADDMVGISAGPVEQMSLEEVDPSDSDSDSDTTDSGESDGSDDSDEPSSSESGGDMGPEDGDGVDDPDDGYGAF